MGSHSAGAPYIKPAWVTQSANGTPFDPLVPVKTRRVYEMQDIIQEMQKLNHVKCR